MTGRSPQKTANTSGMGEQSREQEDLPRNTGEEPRLIEAQLLAQILGERAPEQATRASSQQQQQQQNANPALKATISETNRLSGVVQNIWDGGMIMVCEIRKQISGQEGRDDWAQELEFPQLDTWYGQEKANCEHFIMHVLNTTGRDDYQRECRNCQDERYNREHHGA
jgi:hypothetical protein